MTSYLARYDQSFNVGSVTNPGMAIKANTFEVRIAQISFWSYSADTLICTLYRYESGTVSGGSALDVVPLRQGAPAAGATARLGTSLSYTGTKRTVGNVIVPPGEQSSVSGTTTINTFPGSTAEFAIPLTLTLSPGSVLGIYTAGVLLTALGIEVYFEELRLSGSG